MFLRSTATKGFEYTQIPKKTRCLRILRQGPTWNYWSGWNPRVGNIEILTGCKDHCIAARVRTGQNRFTPAYPSDDWLINTISTTLCSSGFLMPKICLLFWVSIFLVVTKTFYTINEYIKYYRSLQCTLRKEPWPLKLKQDQTKHDTHIQARKICHTCSSHHCRCQYLQVQKLPC